MDLDGGGSRAAALGKLRLTCPELRSDRVEIRENVANSSIGSVRDNEQLIVPGYLLNGQGPGSGNTTD